LPVAAGRLLLVLLAAIAACRGPVRPYSSIGPHVEPLRTEFNRAVGQTRIVMLAAPT